MTEQFDAIVVGSGMTGGWAAKELTEKGLKVLVLERGRNIEHGKGYTGEHMPPWAIPYRGKPLRELYRRDYPIQSKIYAFNETTRHFWNNDRKNPYIVEPGTAFHWGQADVVGGRSILWGRQVYRWSDLDFEANKKDGYGIDWPIRYGDIKDWYTYVEKFIGVSGQEEGLPQLPDGAFLPPMKMNVAEKWVKERLENKFPDRRLTIGRVAILTQPHQGRGACHYCGPCERGCSVGAYFSSLSSTLPAAKATGNLTLRADCAVDSLEYDPTLERVTGIRVIDTKTRTKSTYAAKLVFLCATTFGSIRILLNSKSEAFPNGLANSSGVLGHYIMDHHGALLTGIVPGHMDAYPYGNRPNGLYLARFRNIDGQDGDAQFVRGYGYQASADRADWRSMADQVPGFGREFKMALRKPGPWFFGMVGFGECLPYKDNRIELERRLVDGAGLPQIRINFRFRDNEEKIFTDMIEQGKLMLTAAGLTDVMGAEFFRTGGDTIHEMGGARMGNDPRESVLNGFNQAHDVPNLFVTCGACMASSSVVNPSMTYMALTARAADYAVERLRAGAI
jgi:choline dehydrogenase-like flavoprotein